MDLQAFVKTTVILVSVITIIFPIFHMKYGFGYITWKELLNSYVRWARYCFFRSSTYDYERGSNISEVDVSDSLLAVVVFVMILFRQLFSYFCDVLQLAACFTLWVPAKGFKNLMQSGLESEQIWDTMGHQSKYVR